MDNLSYFTPNDLSHFDGENGPMYIACSGVVYDVSLCPHWRSGLHEGLHFPGQDLTEELIHSPHGPEVFRRGCVKTIGRLKVSVD